MTVEVDLVPPHSEDDRPYPIARMWIDGELFDTFPAGLPRKRVDWLPLWIPFNSRWDFGFYAQMKCVNDLRENGRLLASALMEARSS